MTIDVLALVLDHAAEELDAEPVASRPAPPPQAWDARGRAVVERSIGGDDEEDTRYAPSLAGFLAAMAASYDWGVPVRSSSDPSRYGGGGIGSSGFGRAPTAMMAREEYSLAVRELGRIASELAAVEVHGGHVFDGAAQVDLWAECHGPGALDHRVIRGGPERRVKGLGAVAASPAVTVPERRQRDATTIAERLGGVGVVVTPHEIGMMCRGVSRRVRTAFAAHGWIREERVVEAPQSAEGESMAKVAGYDLESWKEIAPLVGRSEDTCRVLSRRAAHPLPVEEYLGRVVAKRTEVEAWVGAEVERGKAARRTAFGG